VNQFVLAASAGTKYRLLLLSVGSVEKRTSSLSIGSVEKRTFSLFFIGLLEAMEGNDIMHILGGRISFFSISITLG
jgi:hypothetical protein